MPIPAGGSWVEWTPSLDQVAVYVPWLTISTVHPGDQTYLNTFSNVTSPSDAVASIHIADAITLISPQVTSMPAALYPLAEAVAARMAAATLAAAYARTDDDRNRALALMTAATSGVAELIKAIDNAGAAALDARPVMYAPSPVAWGDDLMVGAPNRAYARHYLWPE